METFLRFIMKTKMIFNGLNFDLKMVVKFHFELHMIYEPQNITKIMKFRMILCTKQRF